MWLVPYVTKPNFHDNPRGRSSFPRVRRKLTKALNSEDFSKARQISMQHRDLTLEELNAFSHSTRPRVGGDSGVKNDIGPGPTCCKL